MIPGEIFTEAGEITINEGRDTQGRSVSNTGDRPPAGGIALSLLRGQPGPAPFERDKARGYRLNIPATPPCVSEPGQTREVELVNFAA